MTTEKSDNELIAEFMGVDIASKTNRGEFLNSVDDLRYHSEWNKLMPVVEKIEKLIPLQPEVGNMLSSWTYWFSKFNGTVNTDIRVAYGLVIEFIKFYNSHKQ